jgi:hypothetical protein
MASYVKSIRLPVKPTVDPKAMPCNLKCEARGLPCVPEPGVLADGVSFLF